MINMMKLLSISGVNKSLDWKKCAYGIGLDLRKGRNIVAEHQIEINNLFMGLDFSEFRKQSFGINDAEDINSTLSGFRAFAEGYNSNGILSVKYCGICKARNNCETYKSFSKY